jgi:hypothetical protein
MDGNSITITPWYGMIFEELLDKKLHAFIQHES